ncbi:uncharacterized protein LOC100370549 [Saccoglossus kowalevskii]
MGLEVERFVSDVESELLCPICHCVYVDPVSNRDNCKHTYCFACIRKRFKSESSRFCPLCDEPLRENLSKPSRELQDKLFSLEIVCNQNCGTTCKLKELPGHIEKECDLTYVNCTYTRRGCKFRVPRKDLADHVRACDYRYAMCEACGHRTYRCLLFTHQKKRKCMDKKLANEKVRSEIASRKDVKAHQLELKFDSFALERDLDRVERTRIESRGCSEYGSEFSYGSSGTLAITNGEFESERSQSAFSTPRTTTSAQSENSHVMPVLVRQTQSARSIGRLPVPSPSRAADHPLTCRRCRRTFKQSKNHEKACSWHRGVSIKGYLQRSLMISGILARIS